MVGSSKFRNKLLLEKLDNWQATLMRLIHVKDQVSRMHVGASANPGAWHESRNQSMCQPSGCVPTKIWILWADSQKKVELIPHQSVDVETGQLLAGAYIALTADAGASICVQPWGL